MLSIPPFDSLKENTREGQSSKAQPQGGGGPTCIKFSGPLVSAIHYLLSEIMLDVNGKARLYVKKYILNDHVHKKLKSLNHEI